MTQEMPSTARNLLLTLHIAVTVAILGADLSIVALGVAGTGGSSAAMAPAARVVAEWLMAPLAVAALGSGVALGLLTPWGLFRHWWVVIKLALTATLTAVVLFVLVPRLGAVGAAGTAAAGFSPVTPEIGGFFLLATVALAVFKPGGRLHRSQTPT
jgi:hypothetical protein